MHCTDLRFAVRVAYVFKAPKLNGLGIIHFLVQWTPAEKSMTFIELMWAKFGLCELNLDYF